MRTVRGAGAADGGGAGVVSAVGVSAGFSVGVASVGVSDVGADDAAAATGSTSAGNAWHLWHSSRGIVSVRGSEHTDTCVAKSS